LRASKAIGLYAVAVILLGALFAPWLFWIVRPVTTYPFHRVFDRSIMIVGFIGLWPLLGVLGFRSASDLGYTRSRIWWRHALLGLALGIGSLALVTVASVAWGGRSLHFDKSTGEIANTALHFLVTGIVVALIEETFFRGVLQGAWQRTMNPVLAVVWASVVYATVHFLKPAGAEIPADQVAWDSGFKLLPLIASQSFRGGGVLVPFVTLFFVGCVLGLAYAKTGALYLSVGLHAGWVLANEFVRWLGGGSVIENAACWPMLVVLLALMAWLCPTKSKLLRGQ
jgi:membrane protease YdiL (CAAX protease family)